MKKSLLILLTLFTAVIGYSQTFTDSNFITYSVASVANNTVRVLDYDYANGGPTVIIPTTVDNTVGGATTTYTVVFIGSDAFLGNQSTGEQITSVDIPNSVTYIFSNAFLGNSLTSITIPDGVLTIASGAFANNDLTQVTIPSNVTSINTSAFVGNPLTSVISEATTPATIQTFNSNLDTFAADRSNIDLIIPSGTTSVYTAEGWTGFNSVTEILAIGDTFIEDFITYEVTSVAQGTVEAIDYDFAGSVNVDIPAIVPYSISTYDVTSIANAAFIGNVVIGEQLSSVNIPNSVLSIDENAFNGNNLTDVTIPDSVISIGGQAFAHNDLTNVIIGNNVENIAINAFRNNQLTSITIPASVTSIGQAAFGINPLSTIISLATTPSTITTGVGDSFTINSDRSTINLILTGNTTDEYVTDNGAQWTGFKMVFEATSVNTVKVSDYEAANGANVVIPSTISANSYTFDVIDIGDSAFANKGLTNVTIPDSVTNIGISAFESNNLTDVTIPDNVTVVGTTAFSLNTLTNVVIGANVTIIGIGAFVGNNFTNITIPSNVTSIGLLAFGNNPSLASVTSLALVPPSITTGTNDTFIFDRSNTALHIPTGTMDIYVTNPNAGADWSGFNPVTEDATLSTSNFELANDIKVFNTADELNIISSGTVRLQNYTIYTITGAKVKNGTESSIAINNLSKGIYILELNFNKGRLVKRFAK